MIRGNATIVTCPYCGTEKELMTIVTGNTFGAKFWSDNKCLAPMRPRVSPVQKCPHCGKYYFEYKQEHKQGDEWSMEQGNLNYFEWKEAYEQFLEEDTEEEDMNIVRLHLIQSYNDFVYRNMESDFVSFIINEFIRSHIWVETQDFLLKAEMHREANEMEQCAATLSIIDQKNLDDCERKVFEDIKERMEKGDSKVFLLEF